MQSIETTRKSKIKKNINKMKSEHRFTISNDAISEKDNTVYSETAQDTSIEAPDEVEQEKYQIIKTSIPMLRA